MFDQNLLERIIYDQRQGFLKREYGVPREIYFEKYLHTKSSVVISGIRRSGKSTLLRQFSRHFKQYYYFTFEDERLIDFTVHDFQTLMVLFQKHHSAKTIFLDEIQNVPSWERFVRRLYEEGYKVFLTGSNAKLLSSELATHLTGRYQKIELFPFSFREFLAFFRISSQPSTSKEQAKVLAAFDRYVREGGFPEFVSSGDGDYLHRIYDDILYRDIIARFKIKEAKMVKQLCQYLFTNITHEVSYRGMTHTLGLKSAMTVRRYIAFLQEAYMLFELPRYDYSFKKQLLAHKKVYMIDNGMRSTVAFTFSEDLGKLFENLVFLELRRRARGDIFFWKQKRECDFIVQEGSRVTAAYQVAAFLNEENRERELEGLLEAMEQFHLREGIILTHHQEEIVKRGKRRISCVPLWKWLVSSNSSARSI